MLNPYPNRVNALSQLYTSGKNKARNGLICKKLNLGKTYFNDGIDKEKKNEVEWNAATVYRILPNFE